PSALPPLKHLAAGSAAAPTDAGWKAAKFELLVALDRPQDLEAALAAWATAGDVDGRGRTALGYALAERGKRAARAAGGGPGWAPCSPSRASWPRRSPSSRPSRRRTSWGPPRTGRSPGGTWL